jgi:hypothetical protein
MGQEFSDLEGILEHEPDFESEIVEHDQYGLNFEDKYLFNEERFEIDEAIKSEQFKTSKDSEDQYMVNPEEIEIHEAILRAQNERK